MYFRDTLSAMATDQTHAYSGDEQKVIERFRI